MRSRFPRSLVSLLVLAAGLGISPVHAEIFLVTDIVDAIPPPEGSLRLAIEQSEANNQRDVILFLIDGGTIDLVAPLPSLQEGSLTIGEPSIGVAAPGLGIIVNGGDTISRALTVLSRDNHIHGLEFTNFASEAILISGNFARDNRISTCGFRNNTGAGVRVGAIPGAAASGTQIRSSVFVGNGQGVLVQGSFPNPDLAAAFAGTSIRDSVFGGSSLGTPDVGEMILASNGGPLFIENNSFTGPGRGIVLGPGSHGSVIHDNRLGTPGADGDVCSGFSDAAIEVSGSIGVRISDNSILCSEVGIVLGDGVGGSRVVANQIGGEQPRGHRSHGVLLTGASGNLIVANKISGNEGSGIAGNNASDGNLLSCNEISRNLQGAIQLAGIATAPPTLTTATPLVVEGLTANLARGWVEIFGDASSQAGVFQGAVRTTDTDPPFRHRIPVLGLRVGKDDSGCRITFDLAVPPTHTATFSDEQIGETSELSVLLSSETSGLVYDVIRGRLSQLGPGAAGGIDLGAVDCLAAGIEPDIVITPDVTDPDTPAPGAAFFYLARRRVASSNLPGTYDPALCLTVVDGFAGSRTASSGDCP